MRGLFICKDNNVLKGQQVGLKYYFSLQDLKVSLDLNIYNFGGKPQLSLDQLLEKFTWFLVRDGKEQEVSYMFLINKYT